MTIIRTHVPDSQNNYNHLVYCPQTRHAAAVDPYSAEHLLAVANKHDLTISQIWITHEHGDHIRDMKKLKAQTGSPVYAPSSCQDLFQADHWLQDNQALSVGTTTLIHKLTPGHTPGHGVFIHTDLNQDVNTYIICADTLFNAGVGNVISGDVNQLFHTTEMLSALLPDTCTLYPGHDYIVNNLEFVLHHFPWCDAAQKVLAEVSTQRPDTRQRQNIGQEKTYNPFLSLTSNWVTAHPALQALNPQQRFVTLRDWRNQW